jgi:hypothetical protein
MKEENFLSLLTVIRVPKRTLLRTDTQLFTCGKNSNRRVQKYKIYVPSDKKGKKVTQHQTLTFITFVIIMKRTSRKRVSLKWIDMASDRSHCHALVNKEMNLQGS